MKRKSLPTTLLTEDERRDICLWFGWGSIIGYPTGPRAFLREALKTAERRAEFLGMSRPKRKAILNFVIAEHKRRSAMVEA